MIKGKQIDQLVGQSTWNTTGIAIPSAATLTVTSHFAGKTSGGSDSVAGVYTNSPQNLVQIRLKSTGKGLIDTSSRQIYARLTEATGTWTLSFYVLVAGVETAYNFTGHSEAGNNLEYRWCESVQISQSLPTSVVSFGEGIDEFVAASSSAHLHKDDNLTVSSNGQTAFTLAATPKTGEPVMLVVNGVAYRQTTYFTVSGTTLTWLNVGFSMATTDEVTAYYEV